jgi:folylpolyglutamate synthase
VSIEERFKLDGRQCATDTFLRHFWRIYDRLAATRRDDNERMPGFFRFLTLVAFDMFLDADVDVVILEVGLGGKLDATNVIAAPVCAAITLIDYDHVAILGDTLTLIATEKAGIIKPGMRVFTTSTQPAEAATTLQACASRANAPLTVVQPLRGSDDTATAAKARRANGDVVSSGIGGDVDVDVDDDDDDDDDAPVQLGLAGAHQYTNASMAVACAHTWLQHRTSPLFCAATASTATADSAVDEGGDAAAVNGNENENGNELLASYVALPAALRRIDAVPPLFRRALAATVYAGRCQVVRAAANLVFFLDGAHTPASMRSCAAWFGSAVAADVVAAAAADAEMPRSDPAEPTSHRNVLIFNCGKERNPFDLLVPLACVAEQGGDGSGCGGDLRVGKDLSFSAAFPASARLTEMHVCPFRMEKPGFDDCTTLQELAAQRSIELPPHLLLPSASAAEDGGGCDDVVAADVRVSSGESRAWQRTICETWTAVGALAARALVNGAASSRGEQQCELSASPASHTLSASSSPDVSPPPESVVHASVDVVVAALLAEAAARPAVHTRVLVTGSLYTVGDTLSALLANGVDIS